MAGTKGDFNVRLTKDNVWDLKGRPDKRTEYTDTVEQGLILSVTENGARSFLWQYRMDGEQWRYTIGKLDKIDLAGARLFIKTARKVGSNPAKEKSEARKQAYISTVTPTQKFAELAQAYIEDQTPEWRPSVLREWTRIINKELVGPLGDKVPGAVTADDIATIVENIKKRPAPRAASYTFTVARRLFKWAIAKRIINISPCVAATPFERKRRRLRYANTMKPFSDDQLRAIFLLIKGTELEDLVDLIARTCLRSHEARSARPAAIRNGIWTVDPNFHKNGSVTGKPHLVPLSKGALRVLARLEAKATEWYFPAPCVCKVCEKPGHMDNPDNELTTTIKKQAGIEGYGFLHRLRDTIKTRMTEQLIDNRVSEHIMGHLVLGVDGVYNHAELLPQRKEALEWWSGELDRILRGGKKK